MKIRNMNLLFMAFLCCLLITIPAAHADEDKFNLLTLNLLAFESTTSPDSEGQDRFLSIAEFINREHVDCAIFQEVAGGKLAKKLGLTESLNGLLDLENELTKLGEDFKLRWSLANGIPLAFSVGNAIICREPIDIKWTVSKSLPFASEINVSGIDIKLRRKIMASFPDNVPGFAKLLLINVHLCAFCPTLQRQAQIDEALDFIDTVKDWVNWFHGDVPTVFGGDFNIRDIDYYGDNIEPVLDEYTMITGAGFVDAYAAYNSCYFGENCCVPDDNPNNIEEGCTFAVNNNIFENDPSETARIDYIFIHNGDSFTITDAKVVFNGEEEAIVSDHSGVCVEMVGEASTP